ncbi:hypothetical protein HZH66_008213 [Vespula vulgaris]|uniref:Uncharacterized protein n=1 Tax=Vespula vulgaris TaxID=7454 RepID=A0A834JY12_VESVU|nr:hypothetical protein HZH66_008213 [Vespula vulgaris]
MVDATGFKDAAIYGSQSALRMIFNAKIDRSVGFEQSIRIAFDPNTDSITFSFRPYECDRNHRWDCEFFGMARLSHGHLVKFVIPPLKACFENLKESSQIDHRKRTPLTKLPKSMFDSWRTAKRTTVSGRCDNSSFNFAEETHGRGEQEEKEEELSWWKKDRKKDR